MERLATDGAPVEEATPNTSARDRVRERRLARKRHKTLRTVIAVLCAVGALVGAYAAGFSYFSTHFFPGTTVANIDVSLMTEDEVAQALGAWEAAYSLKMDNGSFALEAPAADFDFTLDEDKTAHLALVTQDASSWPLGLLGAETDRQVYASFDEQKLSTLVGEAVQKYNESARAPVAARIELNEGRTLCTLVDEEPGEQLDAEAVCARATEAVSACASQVELGDAELVPPAIVADSAQATEALARANAMFDLTVPFARKGEQITHVGAKTFMAWVSFNQDMQPVIDQEAAAHWAEEYLWQTADYSDDANAYSLDTAAFAASLEAALQAGTGEAVELAYVATPLFLPGGGTLTASAWQSDLGRYIDVNKTAQVACLYDAAGKVLWETPVTTGNEAAGNGTPTGEFAIYDKKTDFMLIGEDKDADGKPDYEHHVDFWMPFNGNIGLHDASWRTTYGGTEYLEYGSGGCVNVPLDAVSALFAMTHENEVVLVHD